MTSSYMPITSFAGHYAFLSNFFYTPVVFEGVTYPTSEHAFAAAKTLDLAMREQIRTCTSPGQAKRMGRKVALRPGWDELRITVMYELVKQKFANDPLRALLLDTADAKLIEGNEWGDKFWGMTRNSATGKWEGENFLGRILMRVRRNLREQQQS